MRSQATAFGTAEHEHLAVAADRADLAEPGVPGPLGELARAARCCRSPRGPQPATTRRSSRPAPCFPQAHPQVWRKEERGASPSHRDDGSACRGRGNAHRGSSPFEAVTKGERANLANALGTNKGASARPEATRARVWGAIHNRALPISTLVGRARATDVWSTDSARAGRSCGSPNPAGLKSRVRIAGRRRGS